MKKIFFLFVSLILCFGIAFSCHNSVAGFLCGKTVSANNFQTEIDNYESEDNTNNTETNTTDSSALSDDTGSNDDTGSDEEGSFVVTFYDEDKTTVLYKGTFKEGETVTYGGETLSKEADKAYTYSLIWKLMSNNREADISLITTTTLVYAYFEGTKINYTINVYLAYLSTLDGTNIGVTNNLISSQTYNIESSTITLAKRTISGYDLVGYTTSESSENIESQVSISVSSYEDLYNRTYYAWYQLGKFTVSLQVSSNYNYGTIKCNDEILSSIKVTNGSTISISGAEITIGNVEDTNNYFVVVAVPNDSDEMYNYSFTSWNISSGSDTTIISEDTTITAFFARELKKYNVYYNSNNIKVYNLSNNGYEVGYGNLVSYGTRLKVEVLNLTEHYHLKNVTVTDSQGNVELYYEENEGDNFIIFTLTTYANIDIEQEIDKHTITFYVSNEAFGEVSQTSIEANYGSNISINGAELVVGNEETSDNYFVVSATAAEDNVQWKYAFSNWKLVGSDDQLSVSTLTENIEIEAVFARTLQKYQVKYTSSNLTVKLNEENVQNDDYVDYGSVLEVTYIETEHYHMTSFACNGSPISNNRVEVSGTTEITYSESIDTFLIIFNEGVTVLTGGGEKIDSGKYYEYGTQLIASYSLSKNYKLVSFTLNNQAVENNHNFTLSESTTINFVEERDKIKITVAESLNGHITLSAESIECGETIFVEIFADEDYRLSELYFVGKESSTQTNIEDLSFVMPNEEITIYATFEFLYYVLEDEATGIVLKIDSSEFNEEPTLTVGLTNSYDDYAKEVFKSNNFVVYNIVLMVNNEEIYNLDYEFTLTIPISDTYNSSLVVPLYFTTTNGINYYDNLEYQYDEDGACVVISASKIGTIAVGEKVQQQANDQEPKSPSKSSSTTIIIIVVACVVGVALTVTIIIIIKRRKRR